MKLTLRSAGAVASIDTAAMPGRFSYPGIEITSRSGLSRLANASATIFRLVDLNTIH